AKIGRAFDGSWANDTSLKIVDFGDPIVARYLMLIAFTEAGNLGNESNIAEINVFESDDSTTSTGGSSDQLTPQTDSSNNSQDSKSSSGGSSSSSSQSSSATSIATSGSAPSTSSHDSSNSANKDGNPFPTFGAVLSALGGLAAVGSFAFTVYKCYCARRGGLSMGKRFEGTVMLLKDVQLLNTRGTRSSVDRQTIPPVAIPSEVAAERPTGT
ncbi:MAG: hypothetical protein Q9228_007911, partial [Teloschistes exilis]